MVGVEPTPPHLFPPSLLNGTAVCEPRKLPSSQILKKQVFAVP